MVRIYHRPALNVALLPCRTQLKLPLRKNLLGSKRKAINIYFAFILQVLYVGKQFATANSVLKKCLNSARARRLAQTFELISSTLPCNTASSAVLHGSCTTR